MEYIEKKKCDNSWIDKFCPNKIDDIIGNKLHIVNIMKWLNEFNMNKKKVTESKSKQKVKTKKNQIREEIDDGSADSDIEKYEFDTDKRKKINQPKSCMIVTGNHGVGKTCLINSILNTMGYTMQTINFGRVKTNKNIKEILDNTGSNNDIINAIDGKINNKICVVIDELESITSTTGKNCIITLMKNNEINWTNPIIFISNNQHNKLLSDIKKNSYEIKIWPPNSSELLTSMKKIVDTEGINISGFKIGTYKIAYDIIEHTQKDYRRLILTLRDLKYTYGSKLINHEMFNEYRKTSLRKDEDFDLFKATDFLLQKCNNIDESVRYYETEKVLLPLMIHQNYINVLDQKSEDEDLKFELAEKISHNISEGDNVENYIYGEQIWDINDVHCCYTCTIPSYLLKSNFDDTQIKLVFPADLNKASIGKINKKNIINASKYFKDKNIHDYIYINLIIRNLIEEEKMNECSKIFSNYGAKLQAIESLLKVDKIKSSKTNLTSKQKKELSYYFNNDE